MKKAIVFLFLCLAGAVGVAACAESSSLPQGYVAIDADPAGEIVQGICTEYGCDSEGNYCSYFPTGCDGSSGGGGTGGGDGGGGGGGGGAEPYGYSQCGAFANLIPGQGYGGPAHPWCLYIPQKRRCCDYSTIGTPMGCYDEYRCYDGP